MKHLIKIIRPFEAEYPPHLLQTWGEPLYVIGDHNLLLERRPSIVGSRDITVLTRQWLDRHLALFLEKSQAVLISGAAHGVDQAAHIASVRAQLPGIAVIPSGFKQMYPATFKTIATKMLENGGCLVSPFAPEVSIRRWHFELRNQLLVKMSSFVFVAQASRQSGTMMTARLATEANITVATLPSDPSDTKFFGNLDLLVEGANLIRDADDLHVLHELTKHDESTKFR